MKMLSIKIVTIGLALIMVNSTLSLAQTKPFAHPGALNSSTEFNDIANAVNAGRDPWRSSFAKLRLNPHDSASYAPRPVATVVRGTAPGHAAENYSILYNDAAAAYALALDWRVSGDNARAVKAAQILTAWARTLTTITGTSDKYLASGIYGYQLAIAGETLKGFPGWSSTDQDAFREMLLRVFAPMNSDFLVNHNGAVINHYWANWDLCNTASLMAIGIFADMRDLYEQAKNYYLHGSGNGAILHAAWMVYPNGLAQWQESGRDQGHTMLGIGLAGIICELALHQGDDLFSAYDGRLLDAVRYVALYNTGHDVPYTTYSNSDVTQANISDVGRFQARPIWAQYVGRYIQQEHREAPALIAAIKMFGIEGGGGDYGPNSGGYDELGYGTLTSIHPVE